VVLLFHNSDGGQSLKEKFYTLVVLLYFKTQNKYVNPLGLHISLLYYNKLGNVSYIWRDNSGLYVSLATETPEFSGFNDFCLGRISEVPLGLRLPQPGGPIDRLSVIFPFSPDDESKIKLSKRLNFIIYYIIILRNTDLHGCLTTRVRVRQFSKHKTNNFTSTINFSLYLRRPVNIKQFSSRLLQEF
jgi:hypothetical protein